MDRYLFVDGSNLLFQMFYGMPARIVSPQGRPMQGTVGFVGALLKIVRAVQPTHIAVVFDGEHEEPRTALYSAYKANRPDYSALPEEDTPFGQLPDIRAALNYMGIKHTETTICEADDIIAAYTLSCAPQAKVVISSFDSDFFQLISEKVTVLRYRGKNTALYTPALLYEKLGITPTAYAAFKALTGDKADNIPGIPQIGPKTAAALLNEFGTLQNLLAHTQQIKRPAIRTALTLHAAQAEQNLQLILLKGNAPLPFAPPLLRCSPGEYTTTQVLKAIALK